MEVKKDLGSILTKLQKGDSCGFPDVRPMASIAPGCCEVRLRNTDGIYRAFYVIESKYGVLVFHGFQKKTQATPQSEIRIAQSRLARFLKELEDEES